uniref:tail fiber domain-containing protein n=1 Tax=Algoriphagus sp. TaxID=1872435 RepID=UPI004048467D
TTAKILAANVTNTKIASGIDAAKLADGSVSNTELQYINSLTSNAQTQITANATSASTNATNIANIATDATNIATDITALKTLADGKIYLGNGSNVATEVKMSGDVTMTNAGVTTIANNAVTTAKILAANVTNTKIASGIDAAKLANGSVSNTELQYIGTLTSDAQDQIDDLSTSLSSKANLASPTFTGTVTSNNFLANQDISSGRDIIAGQDIIANQNIHAIGNIDAVVVYATSFVGNGSQLTGINAGGAFSTTNNVTSNSGGTLATDDFVFGSTSLSNITGTADDSRFFFDKSKGAFRAGAVTDDRWDHLAVGNYSVAMGYEAEANGASSFAFGEQTAAVGNNSVAGGLSALAVNDASVAIGSHVKANTIGEVVLGRYNRPANISNVWSDNDPLFTLGNGSSSSSTNNAFQVLKNGNVTATGDITAVSFLTSSDRRLKENIKGTKYGLDEVLKLEPVDYNFKSNGLEQIGFIAQDVKTLIPEVVTGKEGDIQKGETLGIAYSSLIPVLTKAIQEQQALIARLEQMLLDSLKKQEAIEKELIEIRASLKY